MMEAHGRHCTRKAKVKQSKISLRRNQHQRKWHHNPVAKAKGRRVRPRQQVMLTLAISEVAPEEATSSRLISPFKLPQLVEELEGILRADSHGLRSGIVPGHCIEFLSMAAIWVSAIMICIWTYACMFGLSSNWNWVIVLSKSGSILSIMWWAAALNWGRMASSSPTCQGRLKESWLTGLEPVTSSRATSLLSVSASLVALVWLFFPLPLSWGCGAAFFLGLSCFALPLLLGCDGFCMLVSSVSEESALRGGSLSSSSPSCKVVSSHFPLSILTHLDLQMLQSLSFFLIFEKVSWMNPLLKEMLFKNISGDFAPISQ